MINTVRTLFKKMPLVTGCIRFVRKYFNPYHDTTVSIPTEPFVFSEKDARKIYSIVLKGALHQSAGNEVSSLEKEFARYHNVQASYAINSGTAALELALRTLSIQPGDEVILPAYTLISTAHAVLRSGGIPVFADIDDTFTISPSSIRSHITKRTKAVIPVHMFGNVANMGSILRIATEHKLFVIEDCCQAVGADYGRKKVGTLGDFGCYSFSAGKAIFAGEGGMVVTSNRLLNERLQYMKHELDNLHASVGTIQTSVSLSRMTEMQASLARSVLAQLDDLNTKRRQNFHYFNALMDHSLPFDVYKISPTANPSFSRLVFTIDFHRLKISRKLFIQRMHSRHIPIKTFYPYPLYSFPLFQRQHDSIFNSNFPFSYNKHVHYKALHLPFVEQFCKQQVGLSFSPYLTKKHIQYICQEFTHILRLPS